MVDEKYISSIVESVLNEMGMNAKSEKKQLGVFDDMGEALKAVEKAYKEFRKYTIEQREQMISKIREFTNAEATLKENQKEIAAWKDDWKNSQIYPR